MRGKTAQRRLCAVIRAHDLVAMHTAARCNSGSWKLRILIVGDARHLWCAGHGEARDRGRRDGADARRRGDGAGPRCRRTRADRARGCLSGFGPRPAARPGGTCRRRVAAGSAGRGPSRSLCGRRDARRRRGNSSSRATGGSGCEGDQHLGDGGGDRRQDRCGRDGHGGDSRCNHRHGDSRSTGPGRADRGGRRSPPRVDPDERAGGPREHSIELGRRGRPSHPGRASGPRRRFRVDPDRPRDPAVGDVAPACRRGAGPKRRRTDAGRRVGSVAR